MLPNRVTVRYLKLLHDEAIHQSKQPCVNLGQHVLGAIIVTTLSSWLSTAASKWVICTDHLCGPFHVANGCLWLISCLTVFEIAVCYGEVKPGRLCRTRAVVLRGVLRQFIYLRTVAAFDLVTTQAATISVNGHGLLLRLR